MHMHAHEQDKCFFSFFSTSYIDIHWQHPTLFLLILSYDNWGFENKEKGSIVADKSCQRWDLYVKQLLCPLSPVW